MGIHKHLPFALLSKRREAGWLCQVGNTVAEKTISPEIKPHWVVEGTHSTVPYRTFRRLLSQDTNSEISAQSEMSGLAITEFAFATPELCHADYENLITSPALLADASPFRNAVWP
jgi:hypothetical protein